MRCGAVRQSARAGQAQDWQGCMQADERSRRHCPGPAAAKGARAALREAVLAGAYFGRHHAAAAARLAAFARLPAAAALACWFGPAAAARLAADPEQCRAALDRDIAALDHLLGEQLDAILHDPRL